MTKHELLALMRLLAALETALLVQRTSLPDQLWEQIADSVERIELAVLK